MTIGQEQAVPGWIRDLKCTQDGGIKRLRMLCPLATTYNGLSGAEKLPPTAMEQRSCGPGEAASHHDTPLSPVINAEDWPRSHRRRTWQRQERSTEPAWNCTDLWRPVHRTQRAITAQASKQKTKIPTSRKLPVSLHGPPLRQSSIQPQRQVSKQKPALSF